MGQQLRGSMFRVLVGVRRDGGRMKMLQRQAAWRHEWVDYKWSIIGLTIDLSLIFVFTPSLNTLCYNGFMIEHA